MADLNNNFFFLVQPVELNDATHLVLSKVNADKVESIQDKFELLTRKVTRDRKELKMRMKKAQESQEEVEKDVDALMTCCENFKRVQSQISKSADAVITQRDVIPNYHNGGANSTASLGRANQQETPLCEKSSTLDADGSNLQQFMDVYEQVELLYLCKFEHACMLFLSIDYLE